MVTNDRVTPERSGNMIFYGDTRTTHNTLAVILSQKHMFPR